MPTLEPGVHDPEEAPWWEFTCSEADDVNPHYTVVKQWMGEAAFAFAQHLANTAAAGEATATVMFTTTDGMTGHYQVTMEGRPGVTTYIVVNRGAMVPKPMELPNA